MSINGLQDRKSDSQLSESVSLQCYVCNHLYRRMLSSYWMTSQYTPTLFISDSYIRIVRAIASLINVKKAPVICFYGRRNQQSLDRVGFEVPQMFNCLVSSR